MRKIFKSTITPFICIETFRHNSFPTIEYLAERGGENYVFPFPNNQISRVASCYRTQPIALITMAVVAKAHKEKCHLLDTDVIASTEFHITDAISGNVHTAHTHTYRSIHTDTYRVMHDRLSEFMCCHNRSRPANRYKYEAVYTSTYVNINKPVGSM